MLFWDEYLKLLIGLLAIMGWSSAIPSFLNLHPTGTIVEKRNLALTAVSIATSLLILFAFFGPNILDFFGISIEAFRFAGGLVILKIAFDMLSSENPATSHFDECRTWSSLAVVPMAMPYMAGPGAITTVIVFSQIHDGYQHLLVMASVILGSGVITFAMLMLAPKVMRLMSPTGIIVFSRIMGLIVASIAVEFIIDGIAMHFPNIFQFEGHGE